MSHPGLGLVLLSRARPPAAAVPGPDYFYLPSRFRRVIFYLWDIEGASAVCVLSGIGSSGQYGMRKLTAIHCR